MSGIADERRFGGVRLLSPEADPSAGGPWDDAPRTDDDLVPDAEIDRLFDRELPEDDAHALVRRLRQDPQHRRALEDTTEVVRMLRRPVHAPDLTDRVLDEVDRRRRFLPAPARRLVSRGRLAAAAAIAVAAGGVALLNRENPDLFRLTPEPRPLTNLYAAMDTELPEARAEFSEAVAGFSAPVQVVTSRFFQAEPADRRPLPETHREVVFDVDPLGDRLAAFEPVDVPQPVALAAISADALGLGGSGLSAAAPGTGGSGETASARRLANAQRHLDIEVPIGSGLTGWEGAWMPGRGWTTGENAGARETLASAAAPRPQATPDPRPPVSPRPVFAGLSDEAYRPVTSAVRPPARGGYASRTEWYAALSQEPAREAPAAAGVFQPQPLQPQPRAEDRFGFPLAEERFETFRSDLPPANAQTEPPQPVGRGPFGLPLYR